MKTNVPNWLIIVGAAGQIFTAIKNQTGLAVALTGLIAAYWTGKVITQFSYYPMYEIPDKLIFKVGEVLMNTLFISFAVIFIWLFVNNLSGYLSK